MTGCFRTVLSVVFSSVLLEGWLHCCAVANQVIDVRGKTLSRGTDKGMAYAKFKAHKFSYLNITSIGSDNVLKGSECGLACLNMPSCFSFNLAAFHDINGKGLCELLQSDMYNKSDKFVASHIHHHFSIISQCISWPCQNNGTCAAQYEKNSYVCVCAKGYTGKHCEMECKVPLGMESGNIKDDQITASSEWNNISYGAIMGRLNLQSKGGSWAALYGDLNQWLQVDLRSQYTSVTGVATQGRSSSYYSQWVTKYKLQHSHDGVQFDYYRENGQSLNKEFSGNVDRNTVVYHELNPPITARYIRFRPVTWTGHVSLRVELYTCKQV